MIPNTASQSLASSRLRVLFLAANPLETERLRLDKEWRRLDTSVHRPGHPADVEIVHRWAVTASDLRLALLDTNSHIVHFSGHGTDSAVVLATEGDEGEPLSSEDLAETFRILKNDITLVFLNACRSLAAAQRIIDAGIDFAIGMNGAIVDSSAVALTAEFYRTLAFGRSVADAFALSLLAIPAGQRDVPRLLNRPGIDPTTRILVDFERRTAMSRMVQTAPVDIQMASNSGILVSIKVNGIFEDIPPGLVHELADEFHTSSAALNIVADAKHFLREYLPDERPLPPAVVDMTNARSAWSSIVNRGVGFGARAFAAVLLCARDNTGKGTLPLTEETLKRLIAATNMSP